MASDWEVQQLTRAVEALTASLKQFTDTLREIAEPLDILATHIEEQKAAVKPVVQTECRLTDTSPKLQ